MANAEDKPIDSRIPQILRNPVPDKQSVSGAGILASLAAEIY
jgi:hypothetical protein